MSAAKKKPARKMVPVEEPPLDEDSYSDWFNLDSAYF